MRCICGCMGTHLRAASQRRLQHLVSRLLLNARRMIRTCSALRLHTDRPCTETCRLSSGAVSIS